MHRGIKDVVLADDQLSLFRIINIVNNEEISVLQELDDIRDKILGARGHDLEKEARELFIKWKPIREEFIRLAKNGEKAKAADINRVRGAEYVFLLEQKMFALTSYARHKADSFINQAVSVQKRVILTTSIIIVVGVLLSLQGGHCGETERLPEEIFEGTSSWHEAGGLCGTEWAIADCVTGY